MKVNEGNGGTLSQSLASFLFSYHTTPHATTNVAPYELFLGRKIRSRLDLLRPDVESRVSEQQAKQKACHDRESRILYGSESDESEYTGWTRLGASSNSGTFRSSDILSASIQWIILETSCGSIENYWGVILFKYLPNLMIPYCYLNLTYHHPFLSCNESSK